jgi:dTDP-4-dehydrorhamnose 3,5-epimerase
MKLIDTSIPDVKILEPTVFGDDRGFFQETWNAKVFGDLGLNLNFVQDNHSRSGKGILRGLHYQIIQPQGKLVRVTQGTVLDVAVDMRQWSKTYGEHVAIELSGESKRMLWIPAGFAHGFYVLSDSADFLYKCTEYYAPHHERSLLWNDPKLNINWGIGLGSQPILSKKDALGLPLSACETFSRVGF